MDSSVAPLPMATRKQSASPIPSKYDDGAEPTQSVNTEEIVRPKIRFDSPSVFLKTFWARFVSIWTKRFILSLLAGQLVSLCITCTNVTTTELVIRGWALPTTQTFFLWVECLVSLPPPTFYCLTIFVTGTSLCSSPIRHSLFTSVSWWGDRNGLRLTHRR